MARSRRGVPKKFPPFFFFLFLFSCVPPVFFCLFVWVCVFVFFFFPFVVSALFLSLPPHEISRGTIVNSGPNIVRKNSEIFRAAVGCCGVPQGPIYCGPPVTVVSNVNHRVTCTAETLLPPPRHGACLHFLWRESLSRFFPPRPLASKFRSFFGSITGSECHFQGVPCFLACFCIRRMLVGRFELGEVRYDSHRIICMVRDCWVWCESGDTRVQGGK